MPAGHVLPVVTIHPVGLFVLYHTMQQLLSVIQTVVIVLPCCNGKRIKYTHPYVVSRHWLCMHHSVTCVGKGTTLCGTLQCSVHVLVPFL